MNRTPLHYAMGLNNEDLVTLLLANDADTTVKDVVCRIINKILLTGLKDTKETIKKLMSNKNQTKTLCQIKTKQHGDKSTKY